MFVFSSRGRHTRLRRDWSSDVCSSDLASEADNGGRSRGFILGSNNAAQATTDDGLAKATVVGDMSAALAGSVNGSASSLALGDDNLAEGSGRASCRERG